MNEMQQAGVAIDTDFGSELLRSINRKSYQNTWSPSGRSSLAYATTRDRRPSLVELEKIYAHLATSPPTHSDRQRLAAKSFVSQNLSPSTLRSLNEQHFTTKKSKGRRASSAVLPTKGNHLEKISEINQTASTSTVFETMRTTSTCQSDDNSSAKSSATVTTTNSKPKKPIRKFIVTPATEPL